MKTRMSIRIDGARFAPHWENFRKFISQSTGRAGKLTRISRKDGGVDYRAPGEYELLFVCDDSGEVEIDLSVNR